MERQQVEPLGRPDSGVTGESGSTSPAWSLRVLSGVHRLPTWLVLVMVMMTGAGCSLRPVPVPNAPTAWVADHGGPSGVTPSVGALAAVRCLENGGGGPLERMLVAAEGRVGAWSWPDRTLVVTEKLAQSLDDEEFSAAVAHELGHLELGSERSPQALAGRSATAATEVAADRRGTALLAASGLDPAAMPRMLRRVAALVGPATAAGRAATARAELLEGGGALAVQARGTTPRCSR
jgi:peptidase M48-like protein